MIMILSESSSDTPLRFIHLIISSDDFRTILLFLSRPGLLITVSLVTLSSWPCTAFGLTTAGLLKVINSPSMEILCYPAFSPP